MCTSGRLRYRTSVIERVLATSDEYPSHVILLPNSARAVFFEPFGRPLPLIFTGLLPMSSSSEHHEPVPIQSPRSGFLWSFSPVPTRCVCQ